METARKIAKEDAGESILGADGPNGTVTPCWIPLEWLWWPENYGHIRIPSRQRIMSAFEHSESTVVWDHSGGTIELYTTKRTTWLRTIARNPNFIPGSAKDLRPGYVVSYPISECRTPEALVRPRPDPTNTTLDAFLTDTERLQRAKAADNLGDKRGKRPQDRAK